MDAASQKVYAAATAAAARMGREGFAGDLVEAVLDSPEVLKVLPPWGVGHLPPSFVDDLHRAYGMGQRAVAP